MRQIRSFVIQVIAQIRRIKGLALGHFKLSGDVIEVSVKGERTPFQNGTKRFQAISIGTVPALPPSWAESIPSSYEQYVLEALPLGFPVPPQHDGLYLIRRFPKDGIPETFLMNVVTGEPFPVSVQCLVQGRAETKKKARV